MNKQEFTQEAALRLINRADMPLADIAWAARELADQLFPGTPSQKGNPETDGIEALLREVERVDEQNVDNQRKSGWHVQKSGFEVRLSNILRSQDVNTVGDLLRYGRRDFQKARGIGTHTVECVDQALQNLYGITEW
jgi:DNA-directed RNA polymerase alpha subunit